MSDSSHFKLYLKKGLSQNLFIILIVALIGFSKYQCVGQWMDRVAGNKSASEGENF